MNRIGIFAVVCAALIPSTHASAVTITADGVIIFTQADVNAGNITPGDTPGFPASLLASGSYRLGSSLTVTSLKNGIVVAAPAVTLDFNGFKLSGSAVGRNGVSTDQLDTTIRNGVIRGFTEDGIDASGNHLRVIGMNVSNNTRNGLGAAKTYYTRVTESLFVANGYYGISCGSSCSVQNSTASNNHLDGIYVTNRGSLLGNVITDNDQRGVTASTTGYGNNMIYGNTTGSVYGTTTTLFPNVCSPACP